MGSVQQRMALLQGLIDTDGCVDTNGIVFFTNTSRQLIDDVRSLVLSLGGEVTIGEVAPKKSVMKTGQIINSGLCFRMQIRLPGSLGPPCRLKRKADRWVPRMLTERKRSKGIVSVTQVDAEKCRCITIAHPDQLYITDDYTVTHNSVSDSVQMLRKNVAEGGQSITGLGVQLATLKEVSKNGITSLPDLAKAFQQTTASAVSLGIPGDVAGAMAITDVNAFNNEGTRGLKGTYGDFQNEMLTNPRGQAFLQSIGGNVTGLPPSMLPASLAANGGERAITALTDKALKTMVTRAFRGRHPQKGSREYLQGIFALRQLMMMTAGGASYAHNMDQLMQLADQILGGSSPGAEAEEAAKNAMGKVEGGPGIWSTIGQFAGSIASSPYNTLRAGLDYLHGDTEGAHRAEIAQGNSESNALYSAGADAQNPVVNNLIQQFGSPDNIEVVDGGGRASALSGSREQMEGLKAGALKVRRVGESGGGMPISQAGMNPGGTNVNFSPATVTLKFDKSGNVTASPNPVTLTPNQQASQSGANGASMNNPPPGDGFGYYRGHMPGWSG